MWRIVTLASIAALAVACTRVRSPIEDRGRFEAPGRDPIDVHVIVRPERGRDAARFTRGAVAALTTVTPWLPASVSAITLVDPPRGAATTIDPSTIPLPETPWWSLTTSMTPELAAARAVAGRLWHDALRSSALPPWFIAGLTEYSARRAVAPLFQQRNLPPGYAMFESRYFGGAVPWFIRVRLLPESDGDPLPAYRAFPRASIHDASDRARRSLDAKTVLTLTTMERWLSTPVFDGVLTGFAREASAGRGSLADFERVASEASGQNLRWLLEEALDGTAVYDYAVTSLSSAATAGGGFDTRVVVARLGDGQFTGTSAPRLGPYESGRGIRVAVRFEDGAGIEDAWDGRDAQKTLLYRSHARAESATVDPDRLVLLDVNRINNSRTLTPRTSEAAAGWAGRWMLWLEDLLMDYSFLV